MFNQYFVKEGLIESKYSKIFSQALKWREMADYKRTYKFTEDDALELLNK